MRTVQTLHEQHQKMANAELGDRDVFGVKTGTAGAVIQVFLARRGRVVERIELVTGGADDETSAGAQVTDAEVLQAALAQFYEMRQIPGEILLPIAVDEQDTLEAWLAARAARRVHLHVPQRGDKKALVELAQRNAALAYQSRFHQGTTANYEALDTLRAGLHLPATPRRIECFDISTIQGAETVASMVVCEEGRMKRSDYRKFRVRQHGLPAVRRASSRCAGRPDGPGAGSRKPEPTGAPSPSDGRFLDDFAAMRQVVQRRYRRLVEVGGPFPDLILIDGGKGQLGAALRGPRVTGPRQPRCREPREARGARVHP